MPRPEKYDRVKKLVAFETGHYPTHIEKKKERMIVTFASEVTAQDVPAIAEKLKRCIPFDVTIKLEED